MKKKKNVDLIIGIILLGLFCFLFVCDCINTIQYQVLCYDEGYNATVAANVIRYGEYKVSYPSDIIFYNLITTGETVILPTALLFKLWGINSVTASITALFYGVGCIVAVWILLTICLKDISGRVCSLAAIGSIALIASDGLFVYVSTHLIGETAALFFILLGFIMLKSFFSNRKSVFIFFAGAMFSFSFLTKTSMIFIVVSIIGLIIIETFLIKSLTRRNMFSFMVGFISGFIFLDLYKFAQLGGISEYLSWWSAEWKNMFNQSGGVDTTYSILDKFNYLKEIFGGCAPVLCGLITILPIVIYLKMIIQNVLLKKENYKYGLKAITLSGICGSSLIVYFVLLGGSGLVYARRHEVNECLVRLCAIYMSIFLVLYVIKNLKEKNMLKCIGILSVSIAIFCSAVSVRTVIVNCNTYIDKYNEKSYAADLMDEFLDEIKQLPDTAMLYCAGWWQEPNVSLYLDLDMTSVYEVGSTGEILSDDGYFIVGNYIDKIKKEDIESLLNAKLVRIDTSEVDYKKLGNSFDRQDFERFAIYKIEIDSYPMFDLAEKLSFVANNDNGHQYVRYGISEAENDFSWTEGKEAEICFTSSDRSCDSYHVDINVLGVFNDYQEVLIKANGIEVYAGKLQNEQAALSFDVCNNNNGKIDIILELPNANSPVNMGISKDTRILGIMINEISVKAN